MTSTKIRPFLKWAGRKLNIIDQIKAMLPEGKRLIEPFVGSGTVFLNTQYDHYILSDTNEDLINLYCLVKKQGKKFIDYAKTFYLLENNQKQQYYELREQFNQSSNTRERAALFLYLNRHGYNGLCRYNNQGIYNVPFGRYRDPVFPEEELYAFHLKAQKAQIFCADFKDIMNTAKKGDVIYCDPPYVPLSASSYFTHYYFKTFSVDEQTALVNTAIDLTKKGVSILISNHDTPLTRALYQNATINSFSVHRSISCNPLQRNKATELLALFGG